MPCYHPIRAWRTNAGHVRLNKEQPDSKPLALPCGTCLGCRTTRAQHWALRCRLEAAEHEATCVTTLTYDDARLPPTLSKDHLQRWLKRLRKTLATKQQRRIRFYACGEYGEKYGRPHYHAILFGLPHDTTTIDDSWQQGHTHTENVSPQAITYICNYTNKKLGWTQASRHERVDTETGEIYTWEPPFQLMSRQPGIGAKARNIYQSWRLYAINNGAKLSVPRFYKASWDKNATTLQQEDTEYEKYKHALTRYNATEQELEEQERQHYKRNKLFSERRKYE